MPYLHSVLIFHEKKRGKQISMVISYFSGAPSGWREKMDLPLTAASHLSLWRANKRIRLSQRV